MTDDTRLFTIEWRDGLKTSWITRDGITHVFGADCVHSAEDTDAFYRREIEEGNKHPHALFILHVAPGEVLGADEVTALLREQVIAKKELTPEDLKILGIK